MRIFVTDHNTSLELVVQRALRILRKAGIYPDGGGILMTARAAIAP